jgi:hypothetical protein
MSIKEEVMHTDRRLPQTLHGEARREDEEAVIFMIERDRIG